MKNVFLPLLTLSAVLLLLPCMANAQDPGPAGPPGLGQQEQEDIYFINLLYIPRSTEFKGAYDNGFGMFYRTDEEDFRINSTPGRMTRTIQYKGSRKMMFFEQLIGPEGEIIRKPLLNVNLGRPGRKLIFLGRKETGVITGHVMDIDDQNFAGNMIRVMNISKQEVKARVGDTVLDVPAMNLKDFKIKNDKKRFLVRLTIAGHNGNDVYLIENRKMAMHQGGRKMLLLYPHAQNPKELTYSQFTIKDPGFNFNYSEEELKPSEVDIADRTYKRSGDR